MLDALETAEAAALVDAAAAWDGLTAIRLGDAVAIRASDVSVRELNHAVGLDETTDVDALAAFYGATPHIASGTPAALEVLGARGYRPGYAWMKFARAPDAAAHAPTELRLAAVGVDRATDFAGAVAGGFGMPAPMVELVRALPGRDGWTCLVAYDGDRPVAAGAMFVAGDQAWLGFGATLPDARGRGAQSALLAARIRLAADAECSTVTTETGVREPGRPDRSYRNILRAGFEEAFERPNWTAP